MCSTPTNHRLAYLISQYPRLTHDFLLQEIRELRIVGWDVHTFSISPPDRCNGDLNPLEQEEFRRTFYIKTQSLWSVCKAHMRTLLTRPRGYLYGLLFAITLSKWHPQRFLYSLFYFVEAVILGQQLRKAKLSHVHSHFTSTVALLSTKIFPVTMSITIHGFREFRDPDGFHLPEKLRSSLFIVAISNYCRSQLMLECGAQLWHRIYVVPLGIHPELFSPRSPSAPKSFLEIICAARLVHLKGHVLLIEAFERIIKDGFPVRLTLVGDGPEGPALRAVVKERRLEHCVRFTGPINPARIREQYERADVFALASFTEGLPIALMEAMAMQIPCVASCITGIPELIRDGVTGLLFSPGNIDDLTRALRILIGDPALRQRIGEAARLHVTQHYNLHVNVARLGEVFGRELLPVNAF
ncbi:MAG TPA: glycosyltransferase family 4 protein [Bryobacteraceae bacterium]|nr:glycosyltransferase family 4 protein [Bryobacteraceae bacterium]